MDLASRTEKNRLALAILVGFLIARLVFSFSLGLGTDESYTLAISRRLSLSYLDHPPLHQWIAHFTALVVGENVAARIPFIAMFFATGWIFYLLTCELFGPRAAIIGLFSLNVTPFYFASAGSWIVPDGPLLLALAMTVLAAARIFFAKWHDNTSAWRLWLIVGVGLGLAGLSKYSAVLSAGGLATFLLLSQNQRHWLKHPAPYAAAIVAAAMITPVILWNARHGWASFEFQGARGVPGDELRPAQVFTMALGEIAFLSPWIFAALIAALVFAFRHLLDDRCMFLLCLSLPPIVLFTVTPLWGGRGFAHWTMPGWFFTFALIGAWLKEADVSVGTLRRGALLSSALLAAIAGVAVLQVSTGWPLLTLIAGSRLPDPTLDAFDWHELNNAPFFGKAPSFVVSTKWSEAGKIALALGPRVPVLVFSKDPRGWAFSVESEKFIGRDGVIVVPAADLDSAVVAANPNFTALDQPQFYTLGRLGRAEIRLALIPAHGLTRGFPSPYPNAAGW
jgi:4-amino-4-deoxy-L-arabinose transferase-like glycosyltransferase